LAYQNLSLPADATNNPSSLPSFTFAFKLKSACLLPFFHPSLIRYNDEVTAARAYDNAMLHLMGDGANFNFGRDAAVANAIPLPYRILKLLDGVPLNSAPRDTAEGAAAADLDPRQSESAAFNFTYNQASGCPPPATHEQQSWDLDHSTSTNPGGAAEQEDVGFLTPPEAALAKQLAGDSQQAQYLTQMLLRQQQQRQQQQLGGMDAGHVADQNAPLAGAHPESGPAGPPPNRGNNASRKRARPKENQLQHLPSRQQRLSHELPLPAHTWSAEYIADRATSAAPPRFASANGRAAAASGVGRTSAFLYPPSLPALQGPPGEASAAAGVGGSAAPVRADPGSSFHPRPVDNHVHHHLHHQQQEQQQGELRGLGSAPMQYQQGLARNQPLASACAAAAPAAGDSVQSGLFSALLASAASNGLEAALQDSAAFASKPAQQQQQQQLQPEHPLALTSGAAAHGGGGGRASTAAALYGAPQGAATGAGAGALQQLLSQVAHLAVKKAQRFASSSGNGEIPLGVLSAAGQLILAKLASSKAMKELNESLRAAREAHDKVVAAEAATLGKLQLRAQQQQVQQVQHRRNGQEELGQGLPPGLGVAMDGCLAPPAARAGVYPPVLKGAISGVISAPHQADSPTGLNTLQQRL
jgi:hypothetical protein